MRSVLSWKGFWGIPMAFGLVLATSPASRASEIVTLGELNRLEVTRSTVGLSMIDWKVGDSQDQRVTVFGMQGTMHKEATREEGNGIWVRQELAISSNRDVTEVLYDRDSGRVLKLVHNGREESIPQDEIEIIETTQETVEVPAGKFETLHVKARSKKIKQLDVWMNPRQIALDGAAKTAVDQGMMKVAMELVRFRKQ